MSWIMGYYVFANIFLLALMRVDKNRAVQKKWRIKERTLFICSILGGAAGGLLGMFAFRHKNRKPVFYAVFIGSLVVHVILIWYLYNKL